MLVGEFSHSAIIHAGVCMRRVLKSLSVNAIRLIANSDYTENESWPVHETYSDHHVILKYQKAAHLLRVHPIVHLAFWLLDCHMIANNC